MRFFYVIGTLINVNQALIEKGIVIFSCREFFILSKKVSMFMKYTLNTPHILNSHAAYAFTL